VFKAMTYYALKTGEQRRFSALVNTVALEADSASQAAALRLINLLVKSKKYAIVLTFPSLSSLIGILQRDRGANVVACGIDWSRLGELSQCVGEIGSVRLTFRFLLEIGFLIPLLISPDPLVPPVKEFRESMRKDMDEFTAYSAELLQQPVDWKENRTLSLLCAALIKRVNKNEVR